MASLGPLPSRKALAGLRPHPEARLGRNLVSCASLPRWSLL